MALTDISLVKQFSQLNSDKIGQALEEMIDRAINQRRRHERLWYENNFFDDGYHFRMLSRKTGRIVDHATGYAGGVERAIPRASRQIRGVSNLLFAAEPFPVVYPERVSKEQFQNPEEYQTRLQEAKKIARLQGIWLTTQWEDEQELDIKLIDMMLLAAKNSVAYLKVYSDDDQKICTVVRDAFDVVLYGDKRNLNDCPFITDTRSRDLQDILSDPMYEKANLNKLKPDNRYATSEIKEAYMNARYGSKSNDQKQGTIMEKETFIKEYLSEDNWKDAVKKGSDTGAMEGKSKGDMIMRHVFSAGGITLHDEYVNYDCYPFSEFRFEPGPLYQKPFITNFIPQNKSTDIIMTRLEKWVNAMIVGVYQKRKGENFQVSNFPGGQMIEYEGTPLAQMQTGSVGGTPFQVLSVLDKYIEEQGATTSALGQSQPGVKSGIAIESLKASEYANLKIPTKMLKRCIKHTAELMLERAHKDIVEPQEVEYMNDGEPEYFDVIGKRGYDLSQQVNKPLPQDVVVLDKDTKVHIEIEPGLGFTMQGQRDAMSQIIEFLAKFAQLQVIPREALNIAIKKFMETFGFGNTQEFMEAVEEGMNQADIDQQQIDKIKLAVAETLKDTGAVGAEAEQKMIDTTKLGVAEAMKDLGMTDGMQKAPETDKVSISYKDLPPEGQVQAAAKAGIQVSPQSVMAQKVINMKQVNKPIAKAQ